MYYALVRSLREDPDFEFHCSALARRHCAFRDLEMVARERYVISIRIIRFRNVVHLGGVENILLLFGFASVIVTNAALLVPTSLYVRVYVSVSPGPLFVKLILFDKAICGNVLGVVRPVVVLVWTICRRRCN